VEAAVGVYVRDGSEGDVPMRSIQIMLAEDNKINQKIFCKVSFWFLAFG
jgi:hypothetical protein